MVGKPGEVLIVEAKIVKLNKGKPTVIIIDGERFVKMQK